ncbi:hypothetical protein C1645_825845 [Glomus cerebriforme]|uniref:Uncharacterized protein n=1 Tax=Glomus cerebriforme TaxID=658196 RepID=A0A397SSS3_9GLOM|nr:hypothetical protein C1645_825845 [Glomus cerebriforme]
MELDVKLVIVIICDKNIKYNYYKAFERYSKSSEGENVRVMYKSENCYEYGRGIRKGEKKAFEFYLKSAKGGHKSASHIVIIMEKILKDESKAFEWYLKLANKTNKVII